MGKEEEDRDASYFQPSTFNLQPSSFGVHDFIDAIAPGD
jgi:hypothetical protein